MTTARYKLVHFVPDPFTGARVPVAAILQSGGRTTVHRVSQLPTAECLGGSERAAAVRMVLEGLTEQASFESLAMSLGPQVVLDDAREVPSGVEANAWLDSALAGVAPRRVATAGGSRSPNRATYGYRFFESWNVQRWVHKAFHPGESVPGLLAKAKPLAPISHYVPGRDEVLLMEPIVPGRPDAKGAAKEVATLFGAYRSAKTRDEGVRATLVAYVLSDGAASDRREIKEMLSDWADEVFDTSSPTERDHLLQQVRTVGQSAQPAPLF